MIKRTFIFAFLLLICCMIQAQNVLEVKDISQPNDVYSSPNDEAAIIIRCHTSIPLKFISSMDKSAEPFRTEVQGSDSVYYIAFPTGDRYRGRELTISSRGYSSVIISLELHPKQLLSFQITDPNALVDAGCYRGHRNKGIEEIKNSNYEEARNQFVIARKCSDVDNIENEKNIAMADSLIMFRQKGDLAFKLLDYVTASKYYMLILSMNAYDNYASNRNTLCVQNVTQECATLFTKAEFYYSEKEYDKAKELYERIVARECPNMVIATERLNSISSSERSKKDHASVLTYEFMKDAPIGLSYGKYNMHKVGGFIQFSMNGIILDAIRSNCMYGDEKFPEVNLSFGWTVKIANPVWIHFGPGITDKMYYGTYVKDKYPTIGYGETDLLDKNEMGDDLKLPKDKAPERYKNGWGKANHAIAASPAVGLTIKYKWFAIRGTFHYRWAIQSGLQDFIGKSRFTIGAGIAF